MATFVRDPNRFRQISLIATLFLLHGHLAAPAHADLVFPQPLVNVGKVRSGPVLAHRFAFENTGPGTVEIDELHGDCGCMKPRLPKRIFQPGEKGELLVEVNTLTQPAGPHTWHVHLHYGIDGKAGELALGVSADLITEVSVQPAALSLLEDSPISHEIRLTDVRPKALTVTDVRGSSPSMKPQVTATSRDEAGHQVTRVRLDITDDCPEGRSDETLAIYTDDPNYPELRVPVTIVKRPRSRLVAAPAEVTLRAAAGQPVPSRIVLLRDNGEQGVVVDKVVASDPAVVCRWAQGPGAMATLKITVDPARLQTETLHGTVTVQVSKPAPRTLTIPVSCTIR